MKVLLATYTPVAAWNTALTQVLGELAAEVGAAAKAP